MKPVFKQERDFFKKKTGVELPQYCWRKGSKFYLTPQRKPFLIFQVKDHEINIKKNEINKINQYDMVSYKQLIQENIPRLKDLENLSIEKTKYFLSKYKDYKMIIGYSGGKDSDILYHIVKPILEKENIKFNVDFFNTTNDTPDNYKHIIIDINANIINPTKGWRTWLKEDKNYFLPSVMVRNCCSTFKEGKAKQHYNKDEKILFLQGMRKYESTKRSKYTYEFKRTDMGKREWVYILPILEWKDEDVWLYILWKNIKINGQYNKGFTRCGCLICPYMSDYNDLLIKEYYPLHWNSWIGILKKNYNTYRIEKRLKWSLDEWINGAWKEGVSKEHKIISKKPTKENVWKLAELKGISYETAEKYFNRICKICTKKLNNDEIAINLKTTNQEIEVKNMICKKCYCKENNISGKEYQKKVLNYIDEGCNLF